MVTQPLGNHHDGKEREGRTGDAQDRTVMELGGDSVLDLAIRLVVDRSSSLI